MLAMKSCMIVPALAILLGLSARTAFAAPENTHEAPSEASATQLEESSEGWVFGGSVGIDYCTKQLTYGLIDNPHPIMTPSVALSFGNEEWFTIEVGVEAIFDMTNYGAKEGGYNDRRYKYQELAPGITLSRAWDTADWLGSSLETSINYTYEYHPRSCKKPDLYENPDTQWLNFEIAAPDFWLSPAFTLEYQLARQGAEGDGDGKGGIYATLAISHTFDIGAPLGLDEEVLTLTPTLGIGMGNKERNRAEFGDWYEEHEKSADSFMFRDGFGTIELAYTPFEGFTIAPYAGFNQQMDSVAKDATGSDDFVAFAGIGVSYSF